MVKTIDNNGVILIDPEQENKVVAELLFMMNSFVSIKTAETVTTLDKVTQYRMRKAGRFPKLVNLNHYGHRKAYRLNELMKWIENPEQYSDKA